MELALQQHLVEHIFGAASGGTCIGDGRGGHALEQHVVERVLEHYMVEHGWWTMYVLKQHAAEPVLEQQVN